MNNRLHFSLIRRYSNSDSNLCERNRYEFQRCPLGFVLKEIRNRKRLITMIEKAIELTRLMKNSGFVVITIDQSK